MYFKRDRYVCGLQNKHGKKACSDNFRPKENELIQALLNDLNQLYFSKVSASSTGNLLDRHLNKLNTKATTDIDKIQNELMHLREKKQKALDKMLDDKIDQDAYDGLVAKLNPQIEQLVKKLNHLQTEESNKNVDITELKSYILRNLIPKNQSVS